MSNKFIETVNSYDLQISVSSYTPQYGPDDKNLHDGSVRTCRGGLEYYNAGSNCWFPMPGANVNINLGPRVEMVLEWAYKKMAEEDQIESLIKKYPALKIAKENYEIVKALVQNETT